MSALDLLYVPAWRFHRTPQVGVAMRWDWDELVQWLRHPTAGTAKDEAGAWSPASYTDNVRRKSALVHACALVVDVDEAGDVDRVVAVVSRYRAIVHETFSSTAAAPRCRIVLGLAAPIDAATYEAAHKVVRAHLAAAGVVGDEGAKDASRVSYAPVRRAGTGYGFCARDGAPLDAQAVLAAQPPPPPRAPARLPSPEHRDAYIQGALRRAAVEVGAASAGIRHYTLAREAFGLARLGLADHEIERALLPAFVGAAGERREHEGVRTIRDAIRARVGVS